MKKLITLTLLILLMAVAKDFAQPVRMLPEITPTGKGRVNTKVDNIGYWNRMVQMGFVVPNPVVTVPEARYTGSRMIPYSAVGSRQSAVGTSYPKSEIHHPPSAIRHPSSLLTPQNSPDIPVTGETDVSQSENSVFIDPGDEDLVINSNNSTSWKLGAAQDVYGADALYSLDGGQDWLGSTHGTKGSDNGDPSTAIGSNGWWYVGNISASNGQSVSYSQDQGKTWTRVQVANGPVSGSGLLDKNHLWIDNTPGSPYQGYMYDAWTNFMPGSPDTNQIQLARSTTQGVTWTTSKTISMAAGALELNHGVNIHTGPNGELYVAWSIYDAWPADETAIGFTKSLNAGNVFTPATRIISNIKGIRASMTGKAMRVNSFPSMAVDNSTGPNRGTIYIVWANVGYPGINTGSDIDVYLIRSQDGGSTWSAPIRVNQDPAGLGKQHFFPWITCDPVTGGLCVVYYDDRNLPTTDAAVFVSWSYDGGLTWEDVQVSDYTFTPSPIPGLAYNYFGDYIGIRSQNMKVVPVWTDNHDGGRPMTYTSPFFLGPNPNQPWVTYYSNTLTPVSGGGMVTMKNGDSLYLSLGLQNVGDLQAHNVNTTITSESPYITITDSTAAYGNIDSAEVKVIANGFTFKVSDTIPDNLLVRFRVKAASTDSTWYSQFSVESHAPSLTIGGMTVVDTLQGNGNGRLDPGETVQMVVPVTNTGDFSCTPAWAKISSPSPYLAFLTDSIFFDSIPAGQSRNVVFTATVDQDTPAGSGADLSCTVYSGKYDWNRTFRQMIGIMIEDWESDSFTKFPWQFAGTLPWTITNQVPWEGSYCARSGAIPDYTSSRLFLDYTSAFTDSISFYLRTSTEEGSDFLLFYIDSGLKGQWSGETPWTRVSFPVSSGLHQYRWVYQKDLSFYYGEDRVMLDYIIFPAPILPIISTSATDTICAGMTALLQATAGQYDSLKWTTTGDGMFGNDTLAVTTYAPGSADIAAGQVTCRLTGYGTYGNITRSKLIIINPRPSAVITVFPNDTVCQGQQAHLSAGTTGNNAYLWTPGNLSTPEAVYDTALAGGPGTHLVHLTVTNTSGCQGHDSVYLTFKDCTGMNEQGSSLASVHPNPSNGAFTIYFPTPMPGPVQIEVRDATGEVVWNEVLTGITGLREKKISLTLFPDGVYLLTLTTSQGTSTHKLILRK